MAKRRHNTKIKLAMAWWEKNQNLGIAHDGYPCNPKRRQSIAMTAFAAGVEAEHKRNAAEVMAKRYAEKRDKQRCINAQAEIDASLGLI